MKSILLISFHNQKALGVRTLEIALNKAKLGVNLVFFKGFNSVKPTVRTETELELLKSIINKLKPDMIGLSVMTSLYLETVNTVNDYIKSNFQIPIIWGGVYPTLFPEKSLGKADFVLRGEGEVSIVELLNNFEDSEKYKNILNLSYKEDNIVKNNEMGQLCSDIDEYGLPNIGGENKYYIEDNEIFNRDPIINSLSYELTASRGCPFVCSYCCAVNIKRAYKNNGKYVRFRSVDNVIEELKNAKEKVKRLKVIHFWDEIFSDEVEWIDEFILKYKKEINLPFEIWGHPLKTNEEIIKCLVKAGLYKVVMGIQSGSSRVRKDVFHRVETQEDIINASKILSDCKVPQVIFDFMLQHPFETEEDIKETYDLCMQLTPSYELQLHGLNFLPGTDIVDMAIKAKIFSEKEINDIMYSPIQEQYNMYWGYKNNSLESNFWYALIFMTQFKMSRSLTRILAKRNKSKSNKKFTLYIYKVLKPLTKIRYLYKKGNLVLRTIVGRK